MGAFLLCLVVLTLAAAALTMHWARLGKARAELVCLDAMPLAAAVPVADAGGVPLPRLPRFASGPLVAALNDTAAESGLTLDEVRYALDE